MDFHLSKRRLWMLLIGAIVFAVVFLALALTSSLQGDRVMAWLGLAFFSVGALIFGVQLSHRGGSAVVVDRHGVWVNWIRKSGQIPWSVIKDVDVFYVRGNKFVLLLVSSEFEQECRPG